MSRSRTPLDAFVAGATIYAGAGMATWIAMMTFSVVAFGGLGLDVEGVLYNGVYMITDCVPPGLAFGLITCLVPQWRAMPRAFYGSIPAAAALIDYFFMHEPFANDLLSWQYRPLQTLVALGWPGAALGVVAAGAAWFLHGRIPGAAAVAAADAARTK